MSGLITQQELNSELNKKIDDSDTNSKLNRQQIGALTSLKTTNKTNLVNSINELYNNTVNGKNLIGQAITQKGVSASGNDSYQTLHDKILQISTGNYELVTGNLESMYATQIKRRSLNGHHKWMVDGVFRLYKLPKFNKTPAILIVTDNNRSYKITINGIRCIHSQFVYSYGSTSSSTTYKRDYSIHDIVQIKENTNAYIGDYSCNCYGNDNLTKIPIYKYTEEKYPYNTLNTYISSDNHYDSEVQEAIKKLNLEKIDEGIGWRVFDNDSVSFMGMKNVSLDLKYMAFISVN